MHKECTTESVAVHLVDCTTNDYAVKPHDVSEERQCERKLDPSIVFGAGRGSALKSLDGRVRKDES